MIPPGFIQDLLARVDIVDVVGRHVELKKAGINHKGLCPFHGEKSPSFIVSPTRQTYHCFGCGVHGNAIGFLMEHTGAGFVEAVEDLAQQMGMKVPEDERSPEERERAQAQKVRQATLTEVLARAGEHYKNQLKQNPRAIDYLKRRGLTGRIAAQFGLGYAPEGWRALASAFPSYDDPLLVESGLVIVSGDDGGEPKRSGPSAGPPQAGPHPLGGSNGVPAGREVKRYDRFRDRIMFPIRNVQGEVIGFGGRILDKGEPKYLNSPETPVFSKGRELYGLFEGRQGLRQRGYALVVEGYMDVVALAQHGFNNAVATLGTACTAEHVQKLFRFTESVIFSFDGDAAGRRAAGRALEAALPHATDTRSIKFLFLPPEHDPDSYVRDLGAEAFERCVEAALPLSRQLLAVCTEGLDMSSAEGRARMLANAKPLWAALPQGLLQRQLLGELAKLAQLPDQELLGLWQGATTTRGARPVRGGERRQQGSASMQDFAGASAAADPFDDFGPPPEHPGHDADYGGPEGFEHFEPMTDSGPAAARSPYASRKDSQGQKWQGKSSSSAGGKGSGDFKLDWKERKRRELDETIGMPRHQPASPMDHALRMLLLQSSWWDQLSDQDHQLLHELPGEHGEMVAWLERFLVNHGASAWSVLQADLQEQGRYEQALRVCGGRLDESAADDLVVDDLRQILKKLWIARLEKESQAIASGAIQADTLERLKALRQQIIELKSA
ncbi:DNA primase [Paucibacter sp. APW11]|uniref:DNA primase n=1 Tax=Roseateles aquae TaxID=3077235 RepID=A0ABU3P7B3_9BURK|nr:DNA primase [Paucibacter sp. APW11]MDT8998466.1 DNA primase [Paucibacter sp. APW11]